MPPTPQKLLPPATEIDNEAYLYKINKAPVLSGFALSAFIKVFESSLSGPIYRTISRESGVNEVLHGIRIPEQPLFWPNLPTEGLAEEVGCLPLQAETAAEAVATLVAAGFMPHLEAANKTPLKPHAAPVPAATDAAAAQDDAAAPEAAAAQDPAAEGPAAEPLQVPVPAEGSTSYRRPTIADYVVAYRSGAVTPSQVAERIIAFLKDDVAGCGWFVSANEDDFRAQAAESTSRWQEGKPLSVLDGVPWAVKDVMDVAPYPTTCGTSFLAAQRPAKANAPYMDSMRAMGACLIGKTSLHEIGLGITGLNLRTGTALNPYGYPGRYCGGSSSGSGAVLAAGLCPIAIGSDGGGSIRIPASFCGVVGLKPTNGRVTAAGACEVDCTVATLGPMAACVADAALLHTALSNFDAWFTMHGEALPVPRLPHPLPQGSPLQGALTGGRASVYWDWFNDADPQVVAACKEAVEVLQVSEMYHNFQAAMDDPATRAKFNSDVRLSLDVVPHWTTGDYIQAQRVRARGDCHFKRALAGVDVLLAPTTGVTAPAIPPSALSGGCSDLGQVATVMKFTLQCNMLGLPAISVPVGVDGEGQPVGFQLIGHPWGEGTLLRYAAVLEAECSRRAAAKSGTPPDAASSAVVAVAGPPRVWLDPLTGAKSKV